MDAAVEIAAARPAAPAPWERWALLALVGVFGLLAITLYLPAEEDAFIYYRYAWNWAHGSGLTFNAGDPVEGFSGPLWMALLALLARLGWDLPRAAPALGLACGALTVLATHALALQVGLGRFARWACTLGVGLSYPFIVWARSGLETPFYSLVLVLFVKGWLTAELTDRVDGGAAGRRRRQWLAGCLALPVLLGRPEGILVLPVVWIDRLTDRRDLAGALRYTLPSLLGYGAFLLWRWQTFHSWVPNTSIKLYPLLVGRSIPQLLGYVAALGLWPVALPAWTLWRWWSTRNRRDRREDRERGERRLLAALFGTVCLTSFFFHLAAGGDYRPAFRYLVPTLPILLVASWYSWELLCRRAPALAGRRVRWGVLTLTLAGSLAFLAENPPRLRDWSSLVYPRWRDPYSDTEHWGVRIARWIDGNVPPGSVVAFGQMGRVPYYLARHGHEIRFIDTLGLVDREVAGLYRLDRKLGDLLRRVAGGQSLPSALEQGRRDRAEQFADLLLRRQPDFILVETELEDYAMMRALVGRPAFAARYREVVSLAPPGGAPYVRIYALAGGPRPPLRASAGSPTRRKV